MSMTANMILILCDDSNDSPFWKTADQTMRLGWRDEDLDGATVHRIQCPSGRGQWVDRFKSAIKNLRVDMPYCVVSDGHFPGNPTGGSELLNALSDCENFMRGVVFSVDPQMSADSERLMRKHKICAIKDDRTEAVAAKVRAFLETGKVPVPEPEAQNQLLSRAMHQLENLALPLRLDVETLESRGKEADVVGEIWNDYFGSPAKDGGFLLAARTFTEGTLGIENEIIRNLDSVRSVPKVVEGERWKALDSETGFTSETVAKELGIKKGREDADSLNGKPDELKRTLTEVRDKILALANELRELRNQLEAKEEGGQS